MMIMIGNKSMSVLGIMASGFCLVFYCSFDWFVFVIFVSFLLLFGF